MAFDGFSKYMLFSEQPSSGESNVISRFSRPSNTVLSDIRLILYKHGDDTGNETFTAKIKQDLQDNTAQISVQSVIATSDTIAINDIEGVTEYWLGFVRFEFEENVHINASTEYTVEIETANYTRNADTFFLGWALDWPEELNTHSQDLPPGYIELYEKA